MATNMVLHVMYKTFDGKRNDYLYEINKSQVLDLIRNEDGCISYNYYLDTSDENIILLVEEWENKDKQAVHMKQAHMKTLTQIKDKYVSNTTVRTFGE